MIPKNPKIKAKTQIATMTKVVLLPLRNAAYTHNTQTNGSIFGKI